MDFSSFEQQINCELKKLSEEMKAEYEELNKLYPKLPTNNWLRMHHKPMIRKSKQVRKKRKIERSGYFKRKTEHELFELLSQAIDLILPYQFENLANNFAEIKDIRGGEQK